MVVAHLLPPCVVAALACRPTVFQVEACAAVRKRDATEVRQSFKEYRVALNEFGLTPASKARVATGGPKRGPRTQPTSSSTVSLGVADATEGLGAVSTGAF